MKFPTSILPLFEAAGWHAGRTASPTISVGSAPACALARSLLTQLQGLRVGTCGAGVTCARSDILFDPTEAHFLALEASDFPKSDDLCALAGGGHYDLSLFLRGDGAVYAFDMIGDSGLSFVAQNYYRAFEIILLGYDFDTEP